MKRNLVERLRAWGDELDGAERAELDTLLDEALSEDTLAHVHGGSGWIRMGEPWIRYVRGWVKLGTPWIRSLAPKKQ